MDERTLSELPWLKPGHPDYDPEIDGLLFLGQLKDEYGPDRCKTCEDLARPGPVTYTIPPQYRGGRSADIECESLPEALAAARGAMAGLKAAPAAKEKKPSAGKIAIACAILYDHPDWTNIEIALKVPCHPKTLSNSKKFRQVRMALEGVGLESLGDAGTDWRDRQSGS